MVIAVELSCWMVMLRGDPPGAKRVTLLYELSKTINIRLKVQL